MATDKSTTRHVCHAARAATATTTAAAAATTTTAATIIAAAVLPQILPLILTGSRIFIGDSDRQPVLAPAGPIPGPAPGPVALPLPTGHDYHADWTRLPCLALWLYPCLRRVLLMALP